MPRRKKRIFDPAAGETPISRSLVRLSSSPSLAAYARAVGGKHALLGLARLSAQPQMIELVGLWDSLSATAQRGTTLEDLCEKVRSSPVDFIAECVRAGCQFNVDVAQLILAVNQPKLTERLVELAMEPEGARFMEMALRAAGRFPIPPGHTFQFTQVQRTEVSPGAG